MAWWIWVIIGAVILVVGLVVEAIADSQKQKAKHTNGTRWIDTGLYSRTRHPNYLGEILVQLGVIDAAKVTRSALQNAVSVATTILSTNAIMTMKRK